MADRRSVVVSEGLPASAPEPANDPRGAGGGDAPGRGVAFRADPRWTVPYRMPTPWPTRSYACGSARRWPGAPTRPTEGPVIMAPVHRSFADFGFATFVTRPEALLHGQGRDVEVQAARAAAPHPGRLPRPPRSPPTARRCATRKRCSGAGQVLVLFPEGTRQEGPEVQRALEGAAFLAARTGAPIVPARDRQLRPGDAQGLEDPQAPCASAASWVEPIAPPERSESGRVSRRRSTQTTERAPRGTSRPPTTRPAS